MLNFEEIDSVTFKTTPRLETVDKERLDDRFSLEQSIMSVWSIVDDLDVIIDHVCESDKVSPDEIANLLIGLKALYQLKFEKTFKLYEASICCVEK